MDALSKPITDLGAARYPISNLAVVTLFSLLGLVLPFALARYGIKIATGM